MSVPGATIRAMPGELELLPVPASTAVPVAGTAAVAGELLGRMQAELPAVGKLGERERLLVSAWLTGLRSARTRRAYAGDVVAGLAWLAQRETTALAAGRVHVDLWAATQLDAGTAASSVRRGQHPQQRHAAPPVTGRHADGLLGEGDRRAVRVPAAEPAHLQDDQHRRPPTAPSATTRAYPPCTRADS